MNIKNIFKKQPKQQQAYVDIKYSKLDHIGKVQRIPIVQKEQLDNIKNNIDNNTNNIDTINNNIDTINNNIVNINNSINTNIANIANNVSNINNINSKVNKITNDLANANIANYRGIYNNQTNYKLGDLVSDTATNNVYLSVQNNNINNPLTNNNFWKIITFTIDTSDFVNENKVNSLINSKVEPIIQNVNSNTSKINYHTNEIANIKNNLVSKNIYQTGIYPIRNITLTKFDLINNNIWLYKLKQPFIFNVNLSGYHRNRDFILLLFCNYLSNVGTNYFQKIIGTYKIPSNNDGVLRGTIDVYPKQFIFMLDQDLKKGSTGDFLTDLYFEFIVLESDPQK